MKSKRIRRALARMGKKRNIYRYIEFVWGNAKEREHLQAVAVDGS